MLEAWQERVIEEKAELDRKIADLDNFVNGELFPRLGEVAKSHLRSQRYYMRGYSEILNQRIEAIYQADQ